jgi:hypothetical protein
MDASRGERLVKLPASDGKFKLLMIQWTRFRAFATSCKFIEAVKPVNQAHLPPTEGEVLDEDVPANLLRIAA